MYQRFSGKCSCSVTCDQPQQRHKRTLFCTTRCLLFYSFLQIGNRISSTFFFAYQKVGRCQAGTGSNEKRLTGVRACFQRCISSSGRFRNCNNNCTPCSQRRNQQQHCHVFIDIGYCLVYSSCSPTRQSHFPARKC